MLRGHLLLFPCTLAAAAAATAGRVELHVHLDGSVTSELLLEIAQLRNLSLPGIGVPTSTSEIDKVVKSKSAFARFDVVNNIMGGSVEGLHHVGRGEAGTGPGPAQAGPKPWKFG